MKPEADIGAKNTRLAWKLCIVVAGALAFGFAIAPFYDVMCKKLGINGKADTTATMTTQKVDTSRWVTVTFTGNSMPGLDWSFHPTANSIKVHPGEIKLTSYVAKNNGDKDVMGVAMPSVTPEQASLYFKKIECFCFKQQTLKSGESKEMPLRFYVSTDLPKEVNNVTLSYAFYNGLSGASEAAITAPVN
jgi:cytochrome c oxidase assembly protein subunit 11